MFIRRKIKNFQIFFFWEKKIKIDLIFLIIYILYTYIIFYILFK